MVPSCVRFASYYMKTFIITQIAKQYRNKVAVAKYLQVKHLNYMYEYNYWQLLQSYKKALSL